MAYPYSAYYRAAVVARSLWIRLYMKRRIKLPVKASEKGVMPCTEEVVTAGKHGIADRLF